MQFIIGRRSQDWPLIFFQLSHCQKSNMLIGIVICSKSNLPTCVKPLSAPKVELILTIVLVQLLGCPIHSCLICNILIQVFTSIQRLPQLIFANTHHPTTL